MLCRLHSFVFNDREVKLIVDDPIVVHKKNRAVLEKELRDVRPLRTEDIEWRGGCGRWNGVRGIPIIKGEAVVDEGRRPEGRAGCPPAESGRVQRNRDWKKIKAESWWPGMNWPGGRAKDYRIPRIRWCGAARPVNRCVGWRGIVGWLINWCAISWQVDCRWKRHGGRRNPHGMLREGVRRGKTDGKAQKARGD